MTPQTLTYSAIVEIMDKSYTLLYLDQSNNLNSLTQSINDCIFNKSADELFDQIDYTYDEAGAYRKDEIIEELKTKCREQGYSDAEVEEVFEEYTIELRDKISERAGDGESLTTTLLRNTDEQEVRIEMHSNYDCINSHHFEGSYSYQESYFGDMVDALYLNPAKVKSEFESVGIVCDGDFPDKAERNGNEYVSYQSFATEISNSVSSANLLTFIGKINIEELYNIGFSVGQVTIPKGNRCGLYSPSQGGGSIMEMELLRDFKVSLKGSSDFDFYYLTIDDGSNGYALNDVYGVMTTFFGKAIKLHKEDLMLCHLGNGVTIYDRSRRKDGDALYVAHISYDRTIKWYEPLTVEAVERIEKFAREGNMTRSVSQPDLVLAPIAK